MEGTACEAHCARDCKGLIVPGRGDDICIKNIQKKYKNQEKQRRTSCAEGGAVVY